MREVLALSSIAALATVATGGCADAARDDAPDAGAAADAAEPALPATLQIPLGGSVQLDARWWTAAGWHERALTLAIDDAATTVVLDEDGAVTVEALAMRVASVSLGDSEDALRLTDLALTLAAPAALGLEDPPLGPRSADEGLTGAGSLALHWALAVGDDHLPLADQTIDEVAIELGVRTDGNGVAVALALQRDGLVWQWAGLIELVDLRLELVGVVAAPHGA